MPRRLFSFRHQGSRAAAFADYSESVRERAASQGGKRQGRKREVRDSWSVGENGVGQGEK